MLFIVKMKMEYVLYPVYMEKSRETQNPSFLP